MSSPSSQLISKMVRAGAGAGKTTALTQFVIDSALKFKKTNHEFPVVVVTTFTRKATQELRERLIREAFRREDQELLEFVSSKSQTFISTIHGVFSLFLKRFAHLLDLDPSFSVLSSFEENRLMKLSLRGVLLEDAQWMDFFDLKELSRIAARYSRLFREHKDIKTVTLKDLSEDFLETVKNLTEQGQEIVQQLFETTEDKTFRAFAINLKSILDQSVSEENFSFVASQLNFPRKPNFNQKKISGTLDDEIRIWSKKYKEFFCDDTLDPSTWSERIENSENFVLFLKKVCERFDVFKNECGQITMDDVELLALKGLRDYPTLAQNFSESFDLWLIDEFQDTSPLQVEVLRGLIGNRPRFVVGDPQQSIYLFRGARTDVFVNFEKEMSGLNAERDILDRNYRSEPELLSFFNKVFENFGGNFISMQPRTLPQNQKTVVASYSELESDEIEDQAIVARIQKLLNDGASLSDIVVLGRTHKVLKHLAQLLHQSQLPFYLHQTKGFFERREIIDALALIKFLVNPFDNDNLILLLRSPFARIQDAQLAKALKDHPENYFVHFKEVLKDEPALQELLRLQQSAKEKGLLQAFFDALKDLKFWEKSLSLDPTGRMEANLWKLVNLLHQESSRPGFSLLKFAKEQSDVIDENSDEGDAVSSLEPDRINLMTVHASKGLQFPHVLIVRMGARPQKSKLTSLMFDEQKKSVSIAWPVDNSLKGTQTEKMVLEKFQDQELKEHSRVLYVAMTRAKTSVHLFNSSKNPSEESWVYGLDWLRVLDEGIHFYSDFAVEILKMPLTSNEFKTASQHQISVRDLWSHQFHRASSQSVTDLLGNEKEFSLDDLTRAKRGMDVHRLFENLRYHSSLPIPEEWQLAVDYVQSLETPPMKTLIAQGFAEWGFQTRTPNGILEGQMDLVGEVEGQWWIIDYKSGSMAALKKALSQLQIYAWCLKQRYPDAKIKVCAIFPFEQKVAIEDYSPTFSQKLFELHGR